MASDNFVDYVKIHCKSGNGGGGSTHFRREKYIPKGGPDGGDGGRGGHIYVRGNKQLWTLLHLKFKKHIKAEDFVEWEEVYRDNFYGTLKSEVERIWAKGKNVIFDIDVAGGLRIKSKFPQETLAVFVKPPSVDELKRRLKERSTESDEKINMRIAKAHVELATAPQFDKIIKNYDLDIAKEEAYQLVKEFVAY